MNLLKSLLTIYTILRWFHYRKSLAVTKYHLLVEKKTHLVLIYFAMKTKVPFSGIQCDMLWYQKHNQRDKELSYSFIMLMVTGGLILSNLQFLS